MVEIVWVSSLTIFGSLPEFVNCLFIHLSEFSRCALLYEIHYSYLQKPEIMSYWFHIVSQQCSTVCLSGSKKYPESDGNWTSSCLLSPGVDVTVLKTLLNPCLGSVGKSHDWLVMSAGDTGGESRVPWAKCFRLESAVWNIKIICTHSNREDR